MDAPPTTIKSIIYSAHLRGTEEPGWIEAQDWRSLEAAVLAAIGAAYPESDRSVEIRHNVSGVGAGTQALDEQGCEVSAAETDAASEIVDRAVVTWIEVGGDLPELAAAHLEGIDWSPEMGASSEALGLGDEAWSGSDEQTASPLWSARCNAAVRALAKERIAQAEEEADGATRTEAQWWAWHDADSSRWNPGEDADAATRDAERRCAEWVSGTSGDGPDDDDDDHGTLMDSATAEEIGPASAEQRSASDAAGDEGHIVVDEDGAVVPACDREQATSTRAAVLRRVYVQP